MTRPFLPFLYLLAIVGCLLTGFCRGRIPAEATRTKAQNLWKYGTSAKDGELLDYTEYEEFIEWDNTGFAGVHSDEAKQWKEIVDQFRAANNTLQEHEDPWAAGKEDREIHHLQETFACSICHMPFTVHSTLEKHMRKCVVLSGFASASAHRAVARSGGGSAKRSASLKATTAATATATATVVPSSATTTLIAEANSLLALAKAPISLNSPGSAISEQRAGLAIAGATGVATTSASQQHEQSPTASHNRQMVLNWLAALNHATVSPNGDGQPELGHTDDAALLGAELVLQLDSSGGNMGEEDDEDRGNGAGEEERNGGGDDEEDDGLEAEGVTEASELRLLAAVVKKDN